MARMKENRRNIHCITGESDGVVSTSSFVKQLNSKEEKERYRIREEEEDCLCEDMCEMIVEHKPLILMYNGLTRLAPPPIDRYRFKLMMVDFTVKCELSELTFPCDYTLGHTPPIKVHSREEGEREMVSEGRNG